MDHGLIYDIGLHVGQDTDFYLKKGFRVVAVEANPELAAAGREKFKDAIDSKRLIILNIGIAEAEGILPFYVNDDLSEWSSFDKKIGTTRGPYHVIDVPTRPLGDIVAEHGIPYYIKLDIEGLDLAALKSMRRFDEKPKYFSLENGQRFMIDELRTQGYRGFKFVNQARIHEIKLEAPAREGQFVEHSFPFGASGPFGNEIAGPWLDYDEVCRLSDEYWNRPDRDASIHGWYDVHACLG